MTQATQFSNHQAYWLLSFFDSLSPSLSATLSSEEHGMQPSPTSASCSCLGRLLRKGADSSLVVEVILRECVWEFSFLGASSNRREWVKCEESNEGGDNEIVRQEKQRSLYSPQSTNCGCGLGVKDQMYYCLIRQKAHPRIWKNEMPHKYYYNICILTSPSVPAVRIYVCTRYV